MRSPMALGDATRTSDPIGASPPTKDQEGQNREPLKQYLRRERQNGLRYICAPVETGCLSTLGSFTKLPPYGATQWFNDADQVDISPFATPKKWQRESVARSTTRSRQRTRRAAYPSKTTWAKTTHKSTTSRQRRTQKRVDQNSPFTSKDRRNGRF